MALQFALLQLPVVGLGIAGFATRAHLDREGLWVHQHGQRVAVDQQPLERRIVVLNRGKEPIRIAADPAGRLVTGVPGRPALRVFGICRARIAAVSQKRGALPAAAAIAADSRDPNRLLVVEGVP
jgi:hypothetical protein